jgi:trigger factor
VTDTNGASVDTAELFGSPADAPDEVEAADSSEGEQEK